MRYQPFLLLSLIFLFICIACKKDNIPDEYYGKATGKFNGAPWEAHVRATGNVPAYGDAVGVEIQTFDKEGKVKTSLSFQKIPKKLGTFEMSGSNWNYVDARIRSNYYTLEPGGDVSSDTYNLDTLATTNFLEVIRYDSITHDLEIRFDAKFYIDPRYVKEDPNAPDTIRFTDGSVKANVHFF